MPVVGRIFVDMHLLSVHSLLPSQYALLSNTHIQVALAHQRLILAIHTLRQSILRHSELAPTSAIFSSSFITSLGLHGVEPAATEHILGLLSDSIKMLDITSNIPPT